MVRLSDPLKYERTVIFHQFPGMRQPLQLWVKNDVIRPGQLVACISAFDNAFDIGIVDEIKPSVVDICDQWAWVRVLPLHGPRKHYTVSQLRRVVVERTSLRAYAELFSIK